MVAFGWTMVPQVYAAIMLGTVIVFWMFTHSDPSHLVPPTTRFSDQLGVLKDPKVLKYCQYYSIVFGGYVALSLWMVQYYVGEFSLDIRAAALLRRVLFAPRRRAARGWRLVLGQVRRAQRDLVGIVGELGVRLFLLSYPQTDLTIMTTSGPVSFHIGLNVYFFTALMFLLGIAWAFGKASVFKYISDEFPANCSTGALGARQDRALDVWCQPDGRAHGRSTSKAASSRGRRSKTTY